MRACQASRKSERSYPAPSLASPRDRQAIEPVHFLIELPEHFGLNTQTDRNLLTNTRTVNASGLARFLAFVAPFHEPRLEPADRAQAERRNLLDVARAMAVCARFRQESRGGHFRTDFPLADDEQFGGHTRLDADVPRLVDANQPMPAGGPC